MRRRAFVLGAGTLLAVPGALGQPAARVRRVGILDQADKEVRARQWSVLEARLREYGYVEGTNLFIERRWADGVDARLPQLARELLATDPEVVAVTTTPATQALMRLTDRVAIVLTGVADPVASRIVASLARPGGNVTGISLDLPAVARKRLELLREVKPEARRVGMLGPGANAGVQAAYRQALEAGKALGLDIRFIEAADAAGVVRAFEGFAAAPVDALLVTQIMLQYHRQVVDIAARYKIPAAYVDMEFLDAGGLLVFGPQRDAPYRHAADYIHRILQGAKPADLPVMQPTEFWLGVNLRTARALRLKIPPSVLIRADRVIE